MRRIPGPLRRCGRWLGSTKNRRLALGIFLVILLPGAFAVARGGGSSVLGAERADPISGGVLDLRRWNGEDSIYLSGEWRYSEGLASPGGREAGYQEPGNDETMPSVRRVPDIWPGGGEGRGYGTATYRVTILLPQDAPPIDLHFSRVLSAYRVFVDGREAVRAGRPGNTRDDTVPSRLGGTIRLTTHGEAIDLTVEVANFHYFRGGFTQAPTLTPAGQAEANERRRQLLEFFVLGGLVTVGLYHFGLATQRPSEKSYVLFGGTALLLALRTFMAGSLQSEALLGLFGWEAFTTLLYLTLFVGVPVFAGYCRSVFPAEFHRSVLVGTIAVCLLLAAATVALPSWIYTATLRPFLLFTAGLVIYAVGIAFRAAMHHRGGAIVFLVGTLLLAAALIRDATAGSVPTQTSPLLPLGALVFTFFQSVILSDRMAQSIDEIEDLLRVQKRLIGENASLKDLTYIDVLTNIANRRRFNETVELEWARGIRHGRPLSLLMIDIDHFKAYNDSYGHGQGDNCLQEVAQTLSSGLRRTVDFVARYGGEEFAVVLPETDEANAYSAAEHLRQQVEERRIAHASSPVVPYVTISVGAATVVPSTKLSPYSLVEQADRALYLAKQQGRNRTARHLG